MERVIKVGISNRHVHLTEETYKKLFGDKSLTKKYDLNQVGEFASYKVLTLKTEKGSISDVRIVGPFRNYNQVEISKSDAEYLGLTPPMRRSGDLKNSASIELISEHGDVFLESACILANRHVHMNEEVAKEMGLEDNERVQIVVKGDKSCIMDAYVKVSSNGFLELHIDVDDAEFFGLNNGDEVVMVYGESVK